MAAVAPVIMVLIMYALCEKGNKELTSADKATLWETTRDFIAVGQQNPSLLYTPAGMLSIMAWLQTSISIMGAENFAPFQNAMLNRDPAALYGLALSLGIQPDLQPADPESIIEQAKSGLSVCQVMKANFFVGYPGEDEQQCG